MVLTSPRSCSTCSLHMSAVLCLQVLSALAPKVPGNVQLKVEVAPIIEAENRRLDRQRLQQVSFYGGPIRAGSQGEENESHPCATLFDGGLFQGFCSCASGESMPALPT